MLAIGAAIALGLILGALLVVRFQGDTELTASAAPDFVRAAQFEDDSVIGRALISASKPLAGLPFTNLDEESPGYKALRYKLAAAGGLFAGSVTVFLSVQIAAAMLATAGMILAVFSGIGGLLLAGVVALCLAFAFWPYQRLTSTVKQRQETVDRALPDFAELLLMPLSSGLGILPSLAFTCERARGLVAQEVQILLGVLGSRAMSEEQAFSEAGARLGTPAAIAFFNTLSQAYIEGARASDSIRDQAVQLRKLSYEHTRAKIKLLPTKLVVVIGLHLMPSLFVVTLLPIGLQITQSLAGTS